MRATFIRNVCLVVLSLAIAACGGGGGGGGGVSRGVGIARINVDGTLDQGFAFGNGFDNVVFSVAPANDGSGDVYVGGFFTAYNGAPAGRIARLNTDGTLDTGFAVGSGFDSSVTTIAPADNGSGDVYVGGFFTVYGGAAARGIARINADGTLDTGFAIGTGFNGSVRAIALANDGSGDLYVGGQFSSYNGSSLNSYIVRLKSDGTRDMGFAGIQSGNLVSSIALANDGSGNVYVGGDFGMLRLKSDGTVDTAFAVGTGFGGISFGVLSIAPASDGSGDIYVGGDFSSYKGMAVRCIARLNNDGTLDAGFVVGIGFGGLSFPGVTSITPANNGSGNVYVGGDFFTYNGAAASGLARLKADGTLDAGFAANLALTGNSFVTDSSVALAKDGSGKVYVGGGFTSPRMP